MSDAETFRRAVALFKEACAVDASQRTAFIEQRCGTDRALSAQVRAMLERDAGPADELDGAGGLRLLARQPLPAPASAPPRVSGSPSVPILSGQYRILRQIGEGGMGVVYEAEQARPRRRVALKMLRPGRSSLDTLRRFEREAEILGRLQHPGIAQIYEAGAADPSQPDQAFIAMEYVRGEPFTTYAHSHRLTIRDRVEFFIKVCEAVQHAHQRGVIHRDLKPANILVTEAIEGSRDQGIKVTRTAERPSSIRRSPDSLIPQPKILDFGVARALAGDGDTLSVYTRVGQLVGTVPYMSPEQIAGDPNDIDIRSDVYALGALLFELLSGQLPHDFESKSLPETARIIREEPPRRLGEVNRSLSGDLETIIAKALEKDRGRRYNSAAELSADLRRFLASEPIEARRDTALHALTRRLHRYRGLVIAGCIVFLVLASLVIISFLQALTNARLAQAERKAAVDAARARDETARTADRLAAELSFSRIERGRLEGMAGNFHLAEESIWPEFLHHPESAHARWALWELYSHHPCLATLPGPPITHGVVACSPDGRFIAAAGNGQKILIWDAAGHRLSHELSAHDRNATRLVFAPDSAILFAGGSEGWIESWRTGDWASSLSFSSGLPRISELTLNPGGKLIAAIGSTQIGCIWSAESGELVDMFRDEDRWLTALQFGPDGRELWTGSVDGSIRRRDTASPAESHLFTKHPDRITSLTFAPGGQHLAFSRENGVEIWDLASATRIHAFATPGRADLFFSRDGTRLVAGGLGGMNVWDLPSGRGLGPLVEGGRIGFNVALLPDQDLLAVTSTDGYLRLWELSPGLCQRRLPTAWRRGMRVSFSPDGARLAAAGEPQIHIWETASGRPVATLPGHGEVCRSLVLSRDGTRVITGGEDDRVIVWDIADARPVQTIHIGGAITSLCVARDGTWLATAGRDRPIQLWNAESGQRIGELENSAARLVTVASSPDGRSVASVSDYGPLAIWDIETRRCSASLGEKHGFSALAYNSDGSRLGTSDWKGNIEIWDVSAQKRTVMLNGHRSVVLSVAFSSDGRMLASGAQDGQIKIWDAVTGQCWATLEGHAGEVSSVALDPTGRYLASVGEDQFVSLWDLQYYDHHIKGNREIFTSASTQEK